MSSLRILMYCADGYGWEHTSRMLTIASSLSQTLEDCSILLLTDLATIGRFKIPAKVDYIHLPRLGAQKHDRPNGLNIENASTLKIRRKITQSAIKTFRPDLVMLDDSLLEARHIQEVHKLLPYIADELPTAKILWGLSDTLGEPRGVMQHWAQNEVMRLFESFADEILVFGTPDLFDVAKAYRMPEHIARKVFYTGYLAQRTLLARRVSATMSTLNRSLPLVVLTAGCCSDDFVLLKAYLRLLESSNGDLAIRSFIVAGPTIASHEKRQLAWRAQRLPNVVLRRFGRHLARYLGYADLVICNGRYDVMCDILTYGKTAIVVPSPLEQPDNFFRARLFQERGLVAMMQPEDCQPSALLSIISTLISSNVRPMKKTRHDEIPLNGLAKLVERLQLIKGSERPDEIMTSSLAA